MHVFFIIGSNDCSWEYGQNITLTYDVALTKAVSSGKIHVSAKLDSIIPFDAECAVCGENCTITVPIVGTEETIVMPPCPIDVIDLSDTLAVMIPDKNPLGVKTTVKDGSLTVTNQDGANVVALTFTATLN